jgi:putative transposase
MITERKHRLPIECYTGFITCAFTACVDGKKKLFVTDEIVQPLIVHLKRAVEKHDVRNRIYVFMPDHCHIILEGKSEQSNLWKCMKLFKQLTGYYLAENCFRFRWQKGFYDHIIRSEKDINKHTRYVADNPVRGGLVKNFMEYPYTGSLNYPLTDILE